MLSNVVPIIGSVNKVGIIHDAVAFQTTDETINYIIDSLQSLKAASVVVVIGINHCLILLREIFDPGDTTILD